MARRTDERKMYNTFSPITFLIALNERLDGLQLLPDLNVFFPLLVYHVFFESQFLI